MFFQNLWLNFAKHPGNFVKGWQKNDICVFSILTQLLYTLTQYGPQKHI